MRKLTLQEQQWVESVYPLVKEIMEIYNLSENDTIDWHGELSVALCEAVIEISPYSYPDTCNKQFGAQDLDYIALRLQDRICIIRESEQYQIKEIPSGLRPHRAVGRGRSL